MKKDVLFILLLLSVAFCYGGNTSIAPDSIGRKGAITIMTYNVKFLPRGAVMIHHHPVIRAKLIPAKLIAENPDIIVFEEAFDGKAIRALKKRLKGQYPYMAGGDNRKVITYKRAGGVLIFSKYPLKEIESIKYSECKGYDCLGNKGAILVAVDHPVHKFQLLGTHLQAGGSVALKTSQYQEAAELLKRHQQNGMPQFVAGDFNTHKEDTALYPRMIACIQGQDGNLEGELTVETAHAQNDMRDGNKSSKNKSGKPKGAGKKKGVIDYILVKENGVTFTSQYRYAREFEQRWSKQHKDLSDHFAVILKVTL